MQGLAGADPNYTPSFEDLLSQETDEVVRPTGKYDPTSFIAVLT